MTRMFALVLFCVSAHAYSQEANRPTYKVGDKWLVERTDLWKNEVSDSRESRVVEVSSSATKLEQKNPSTGGVTPWIIDPDGNTLEFGGRKAEVKFINFTFPLSVGKKWSYQASGSNPAGNGTLSVDTACEVLAFEDVATKAGSLNAYKIKCDGTYRNTNDHKGWRWNGSASSMRWYSPDVRFTVKFEYKDTRGDGSTWSHYSDQLVSFELQK